jgi:hypothetical protein
MMRALVAAVLLVLLTGCPVDRAPTCPDAGAACFTHQDESCPDASADAEECAP